VSGDLSELRYRSNWKRCEAEMLDVTIKLLFSLFVEVMVEEAMEDIEEVIHI